MVISTLHLSMYLINAWIYRNLSKYQYCHSEKNIARGTHKESLGVSVRSYIEKSEDADLK